MKKLFVIMVILVAIICGSCSSDQITSTPTNEDINQLNNDNVILVINCNVTLPKSSELPTGYDWIDNIKLEKSAENITNAYVYYADGIFDGENDNLSNQPFDASFVITSINDDKRSGRMEVTVVSKNLVAEKGRYFRLALVNKSAKTTVVANTEYILWNKPIKLGDKVICDATADGIYVGFDLLSVTP